MIESRLLPLPFSDLEPFAPRWALPTEPERYAQRLASDQGELVEFYNAVSIRISEMRAHLDSLELERLEPADRRLMWLALSFVTVAFAVEVWEQPAVPNSDGIAFPRVIEPYRPG